MQDAIHQFLKKIGVDTGKPGMKKTPERFTEAMQFLTGGYKETLEEVVGEALFPAETEELVLVREIEFYSLCEHHLLPFFGKVHIGYLPGKEMIGLSKIPRIVDLFARRLQTQERLGEQILEALETSLKPRGLAVIVEARHLCMMMRGVKKQHPSVLTRHFGGILKKEGSLRKEFLDAVRA